MRLFHQLLCIGALLFPFGASAAEAASDPKDGVQYRTLAEAQNTDAGDKVEVIEFFAYYCPHCNSFDPLLAAWVKQQGDKIVFKRVHVALQGGAAAQQKLYFTLESLGLLAQYHSQVFNAIHEQHQRLNSDEAVLAWATKAGIDPAKFGAAARSFGMTAKLRRADALSAAYKIDFWPQVAIGGHYLTAPSLLGETMPESTEAMQQQAALKVMDFLLSKAQAEKKR